jgi:hypothetical protein
MIKKIIYCVAAIVLLAFSGGAFAQDYPNQPIRAILLAERSPQRCRRT